MEQAKDEKQESNECNENDPRKSHTRENSDESEEKLATFADVKEEEQNNEVPKESNPISASDDGVTDETPICKVCGKQFATKRGVRGHMRMHSGEKRAAEIGSHGGKEEGSSSIASKKYVSITFKPPRKPDSGNPRNPVLNGGSHAGEARSSNPMEDERSSSHPRLAEASASDPEDDPVVIYLAETLWMMMRGLRDNDQLPSIIRTRKK